MNLLKIGDISKTCDISIKTLRFYEEIGLITPAKVDIYTGYRYFDEKNVELIYKIKFLKDLGFSLEEIKTFDESQIDKKLVEVQKQISKLKNNLKTLSSLKQKKENITMKPFINDIQAIGKWNYIATTESKEEYLKGKKFVDKDIYLQNLYFLPNGEGYWIFDSWTKGQLNCFNGVKYTYEIIDGILFLTTFDENEEKENVLVYKKDSDTEFTKSEIKIKDDINLPFVEDKNAVGFYKAIGVVDYKDKSKFLEKLQKSELYVKSLSLAPNGEAIFEIEDGIFKHPYTKGKIINNYDETVDNYTLKTFDGKTYLIMDWKSGDYSFCGKISCCYVFEKI